MAETVVGLSSVCSEISTREIGPKRRIASMTWKRLIARISSGSAVFIAAPSAGLGDIIMRMRIYFAAFGRMSMPLPQ